MKWTVLFFCCLGIAAAAELTGGRTVYILPMGRGLDQFVANRLTRMHVFQVVTDPAKADTVITDQVGADLEDRLKDLYPAPEPKPEPAEATPQAKEAAGKKPAEPAKPGAEAPKNAPAAKPEQPSNEVTPLAPGAPAVGGDTANKGESRGYMAVGGRGRGTVFLVDVKSREVLWSLFERPKNTSPRELDRTAERIVKRLKEDLAGK